MHGDWFPSASAVSGAPGEPDEEVTHETKSMFSFAFSLILFQECVAASLFPGLRSSLLRPDSESSCGLKSV